MLSKYYCTACNATPSVEKEVFYGCSKCGNKLFKIHDERMTRKVVRKGEGHKDPQSIKDPDLDFTTISMEGQGVFQIDVDKLLKENDSKILTVTDKNGVIHLKL